MKKYYTEEEKNKLRKAFYLVLDGIRELWNTANHDGDFVIKLDRLKIYAYPLHQFGINKKRFG